LSEIHEFAKRFAVAANFGVNSLVLEISLLHVARRLLMAGQIERAWHGFYAATVDELPLPSKRMSVAEFGVESKDLAISAALWVFDKFGWNPPREVVAADQERFYARKF
jgi:hypothetical protein